MLYVPSDTCIDWPMGRVDPGAAPLLRSVGRLIADKPQVELVPREEVMCEGINLDFGCRNGEKNK